jgi:hypothetical protein
MENKELPPINKVVTATCKRANGDIETHHIRRIKTKDTAKGWQWSHATINTYFTPEVLNWK